MSMPSHTAVRWLVGFLLIAGLLLSSDRMHAYRDNLPAEHLRAEALMVDPTLLKIASGEFKGLMADYLVLKAAIFQGGFYKSTADDWQAMYMLFKQSIVLDPYFFMTGYYTQGILGWRPGMHAKAIDILTIQAKHRSWDWEPKFYLGFDYFYYLKDNETGARYLREAAELPDAPPITATLAARLAQRSGQTLTAIAFLKAMLERAQDEEYKKMYALRLQVLLGVHQLEQARDRYITMFGKKPSSLDDLVSAGIIDKIPDNPMSNTYYYDPDTGDILMDPPR